MIFTARSQEAGDKIAQQLRAATNNVGHAWRGPSVHGLLQVAGLQKVCNTGN